MPCAPRPLGSAAGWGLPARARSRRTSAGPTPLPTLLSESHSVSEAPFRFHHPVVVRLWDIDVGGHAHRSEALMYFEEARAAYWREVVGKGGSKA